MRVFIGMKPGRNAQIELGRVSSCLKKAVSGSFTREDNIHLTLAFLGEQQPSRIDDIKAAMCDIKSGAANLSLAGLGSFKKTGGSVIWCGVKGETQALECLYGELCSALLLHGIEWEQTKLTPHITLCRQARIDDADAYASISPASTALGCKELVLFHSDRIDGILRYIPIYVKPL